MWRQRHSDLSVMFLQCICIFMLVITITDYMISLTLCSNNIQWVYTYCPPHLKNKQTTLKNTFCFAFLTDDVLQWHYFSSIFCMSWMLWKNIVNCELKQYIVSQCPNFFWLRLYSLYIEHRMQKDSSSLLRLLVRDRPSAYSPIRPAQRLTLRPGLHMWRHNRSLALKKPLAEPLCLCMVLSLSTTVTCSLKNNHQHSPTTWQTCIPIHTLLMCPVHACLHITHACM